MQRIGNLPYEIAFLSTFFSIFSLSFPPKMAKASLFSPFSPGLFANFYVNKP